MRPSSTLPLHPAVKLPEGRPALNPGSLLSLILLAGILLVGPCVLGAVRPWIELPILGAVTLLLLLQAGRLTVPAPLGSLRQIDAIDLSVLLFVIYALIRWLTSPTEYFSRFEALSVIGYAVVFLFCRYGLGRRKYGVTLLMLLGALGVGEVIFGYLFHLHSNASDPQSLWFPFGPSEQMQLFWAPRWIGTYGCPNNYACLLVMATGASLALACFSRFPWPARIVFFYAAALLLVGIHYSQSRGSWFSLVGAIAALIYFALRYGRFPWWVPAAGGAVLVGILGTIFLTSRIVDKRVGEMTHIVESGSLDRYLRYELTVDALRIAHEHPLFGTGPGTFAFLDPQYQVPTLAVRAGFTHDDYLNCLDDYGLVGFGIAMFFVAAVTLALGSKIQTDSRWTERVLVAAALMAWSALLVHSFLDFNLHIPANAMLLFGLTGMALARRPGQDAPYHWSTISLLRFGPWLGWGLGVFALLYGAEITRTLLTDLPYEKAAADADVAPTIQSIGQLDKALSYDGGNVQALILLGDLRRLRASRAETTEERMTEGAAALAAYQKALQGNPLDTTIRAELGVTYDILQRYSEAYFCFEAAVTAEPYNGQFWMALGNHFFSRGLLEKAEEAYTTAAACPLGRRGAAESAKKVGELLGLKNFLPPESVPAHFLPPTTPATDSAPAAVPAAVSPIGAAPLASPAAAAPPTVPAPAATAPETPPQALERPTQP